MDRAAAQAWLDRYVSAWLSYNANDIAQLFADDVAYRYHPNDDPIVGRAAVVASWLGESESDEASARDAPGTYSARYAPVAVDGDVSSPQASPAIASSPTVPPSGSTTTASSCGSMPKDDAANSPSTTCSDGDWCLSRRGPGLRHARLDDFGDTAVVTRADTGGVSTSGAVVPDYGKGDCRRRSRVVSSRLRLDGSAVQRALVEV